MIIKDDGNNGRPLNIAPGTAGESVGSTTCHGCKRPIPAGELFIFDVIVDVEVLDRVLVARCSVCEAMHNWEGSDNDPTIYDPDLETETGYYC